VGGEDEAAHDCGQDDLAMGDIVEILRCGNPTGVLGTIVRLPSTEVMHDRSLYQVRILGMAEGFFVSKQHRTLRLHEI